MGRFKLAKKLATTRAKETIGSVADAVATGVWPGYRQLKKEATRLYIVSWTLANSAQMFEGILNRLMNDPELPEEVRKAVIEVTAKTFADNKGFRITPDGKHTVDMGEFEVGEAPIEVVQEAIEADTAEVEARKQEASNGLSGAGSGVAGDDAEGGVGAVEEGGSNG